MLPKCHSATKQKPLSPKYRTKQLMIRTIESTHSSPQAILQADHPGKTSEDRVSQSVLNREGDRTQPPASVIPWDSLPTPHLPFFSFKNCHGWAESLELVSGHESIFCPDCWLYWLKHLSFLLAHYLLNYWLMRGEQSHLGLVTFSFPCFSILMFCMSLRTNLNVFDVSATIISA